MSIKELLYVGRQAGGDGRAQAQDKKLLVHEKPSFGLRPTEVFSCAHTLRGIQMGADCLEIREAEGIAPKRHLEAGSMTFSEIYEEASAARPSALQLRQQRRTYATARPHAL